MAEAYGRFVGTHCSLMPLATCASAMCERNVMTGENEEVHIAQT